MIKNLNKFLAVLGTAILLTVAYSNASAQKAIYLDSFKSKTDSASSPALPKGWTTTGGSKKWVFTNENKVTSPVAVDYSFDADANPSHGAVYGVSLDTAAVLSSPDLGPTTGYKNITALWVEEFSPKWEANNDSGSSVAYSIDNTTWDTIAYTRFFVGNTFGIANGGTPIALPANAANAAHLYLRWTFHPKLAKGNYAFTDLVISGTPTTTGINEVLYATNSKVNAFYSNNNLDVRFNNCGNATAQMAVYGMDGKQVLGSSMNTGSDQIINVSNLSAGVYVAKFSINGEVYTSKFVK